MFSIPIKIYYLILITAHEAIFPFVTFFLLMALFESEHFNITIGKIIFAHDLIKSAKINCMLFYLLVYAGHAGVGTRPCRCLPLDWSSP